MALPKRGYLISQSLSSTICRAGLMLMPTLRIVSEGVRANSWQRGRSLVHPSVNAGLWLNARLKDLQAERARLTHLWADGDQLRPGLKPQRHARRYFVKPFLRILVFWLKEFQASCSSCQFPGSQGAPPPQPPALLLSSRAPETAPALPGPQAEELQAT